MDDSATMNRPPESKRFHKQAIWADIRESRVELQARQIGERAKQSPPPGTRQLDNIRPQETDNEETKKITKNIHHQRFSHPPPHFPSPPPLSHPHPPAPTTPPTVLSSAKPNPRPAPT